MCLPDSFTKNNRCPFSSHRVYARDRVNRGRTIFHVFAHFGQRRFEGLDRELRSILKEKGLRHDDLIIEKNRCYEGRPGTAVSR